MSVPQGKTSPLMLAAAWIVVGIPLAWGIYQTGDQVAPSVCRAGPAGATRPVHSTESEKTRPQADEMGWQTEWGRRRIFRMPAPASPERNGLNPDRQRICPPSSIGRAADS